MSIPYCPACEAWSEHIVDIHEFLETFDTTLSAELRKLLELVWDQCNGLSAAAFHCDDWDMFTHFEWDEIRLHARQALAIIGWEDMRAHMEQLTLDCRAELRKK